MEIKFYDIKEDSCSFFKDRNVIMEGNGVEFLNFVIISMKIGDFEKEVVFLGKDVDSLILVVEI